MTLTAKPTKRLTAGSNKGDYLYHSTPAHRLWYALIDVYQVFAVETLKRKPTLFGTLNTE